MNAQGEPILLEIVGISKTFPGVRALDRVDLELRVGEVHAIVGENGAGKSTLVKILSGVYQPDSGYIEIDGRRLNITSPAVALQLGIAYIPQELTLVPSLTVAENILLGVEPKVGPLGLLRHAELTSRARAVLEQANISLDPDSIVENLSTAQCQMVGIARALARRCRIMIMDEPTAPFAELQIESLFALIRRLKAQGISFLYISHRMAEIFRIVDRVTVLRDGKLIGTLDIEEATAPGIIMMMVGRPVSDMFPERKGRPGDEVLRVEGLTRDGVLTDIHFTLREGEILGVAGLLGSGRTELVRAIFGVDACDRGTVYVRGHPVVVDSPSKGIAFGMGLVPEERKSQGLFLDMSVKHNITIALIGALARNVFIDGRRETMLAGTLANDLKIRCPSIDSEVLNLSGGNQQKVILARWLGRETRILLLDDPTRGIDVGAKAEVYGLLARLAEQGVAIVLISSDWAEVTGMSDRVIVLRNGRLVGEFSRDQVTQHELLALAIGLEDSEPRSV